MSDLVTEVRVPTAANLTGPTISEDLANKIVGVSNQLNELLAGTDDLIFMDLGFVARLSFHGDIYDTYLLNPDGTSSDFDIGTIIETINIHAFDTDHLFEMTQKLSNCRTRISPEEFLKKELLKLLDGKEEVISFDRCYRIYDCGTTIAVEFKRNPNAQELTFLGIVAKETGRVKSQLTGGDYEGYPRDIVDVVMNAHMSVMCVPPTNKSPQ